MSHGPSSKVVQFRRLFDWTNMAAALPQFFGATRYPCIEVSVRTRNLVPLPRRAPTEKLNDIHYIHYSGYLGGGGHLYLKLDIILVKERKKNHIIRVVF